MRSRGEAASNSALPRRSLSLGVLGLILVLGAFFQIGCDLNPDLKDMMGRMAPDDDEEFAKRYLEILRNEDFDTAIRLLDPRFVKAGIESDLTAVASLLRQGDPISLELVGCKVFSGPDKRRTKLTYQYQFPNSWLLASVLVETVDGQKRIFEVRVNPTPKSAEELNAFTLSGRSVHNYVMLLLAMLIPIFIVVSLVVCIRTKLKKLKWLWIIFILLGFGRLGLNWSTGQVLFNPLSFHVQLLGASMVRQGLYAPWIITISPPLGAIIFLACRRRLQVARPPRMPSQDQETRETQPADPPDSERTRPFQDQ